MVEFVVRQMRGVLQPDGDAELMDVVGNVAHVRYRRASNPKCLECVVSPDDLRVFLMDLLAKRAPHISDVEIEVVDS